MCSTKLGSIIATTLLWSFLVANMPASAADLGTPLLSPPLSQRDFLQPGKLLKKGLPLEQSDEVVIEPQLGLGHARREREVPSGYDITDTIHAQAGGEVRLFRIISLSASAKLPVYSIESYDRLIAGASSQVGVRRHDYHILRPAENVSWTGQLGFSLGAGVDLNLFYDQNRSDVYLRSGAGTTSNQEERFGTRLIFRFR